MHCWLCHVKLPCDHPDRNHSLKFKKDFFWSLGCHTLFLTAYLGSRVWCHCCYCCLLASSNVMSYGAVTGDAVCVRVCVCLFVCLSWCALLNSKVSDGVGSSHMQNLGSHTQGNPRAPFSTPSRTGWFLHICSTLVCTHRESQKSFLHP